MSIDYDDFGENLSDDEILKLLNEGQEQLDKRLGKSAYKLPEFDDPKDRPLMLVVDDEQGYLDQLEQCINDSFPKSIGYHFINPMNYQGQDVVEMILDFYKDNRLDLIVLDQNMPGQNGMECLRKIRKVKELQYVPVFFVTQVSYEKARDTAMKASQSGAQRTIFIKKPDPKLVHDIITGLDSALDELLDQRWTDLLARFSELIHRSQNSEKRQHASKHIDDILAEGGRIIERILGYECLIRENKVGENTLKLKFDTSRHYLSEFLEIPGNEIPMFRRLIEQDMSNVIAFDNLTSSDLGNNKALRKYKNRPALICKLVYKTHCVGTLGLYKNKGDHPFREKDKHFIENLVLQMSIYIAEYRDARELRTHQSSIAEFGAEISVKDNIEDVIQMLGDRLHDEINHGQDSSTKTTIRMLSHSEALLKRVFERGIKPVCDEDISLEDYCNSSHAKAAISLQSVFNQTLKIGNKTPFKDDVRINSCLTVPLKWQNIVLGTVNLESEEDYYYFESDKSLVETLCSLAASTIYSIRQAEFQQKIFHIVKRVDDLTSRTLFDEVIYALYDFIPFRNIVGLKRNKEARWDYGIEFVYSSVKNKLDKDNDKNYWAEYLNEVWENTYIYESIHNEKGPLFSIMHQRVWDDELNKEKKVNPYPDEGDKFQGRPTRTQVVIKIMDKDSTKGGLPKYILFIQYPVNIFDNSWEEGMLREFCELASSLLSNIENVNWLYGERYIAQQQTKLTKAYSYINHGIRSKLGIISNYLNQVEISETRSLAIRSIREAIYATKGLIDGMSLYVKIPEPADYVFADIWEEATRDIKEEIATTSLSISILSFKPQTIIHTDKDILKIVLFNLAQNAFEHIVIQSCGSGTECEGGPFKIWAEVEELESEVQIYVCNTGSTMILRDEEIFEMGVSGKGNGAGTGLYYSRDKFSELGGVIEYDVKDNADVTFKLTLPKEGTVNE